jgi:hypothetical protein
MGLGVSVAASLEPVRRPHSAPSRTTFPPSLLSRRTAFDDGRVDVGGCWWEWAWLFSPDGHLNSIVALLVAGNISIQASYCAKFDLGINARDTG